MPLLAEYTAPQFAKLKPKSSGLHSHICATHTLQAPASQVEKLGRGQLQVSGPQEGPPSSHTQAGRSAGVRGCGVRPPTW